jgi:hypothetical protein
VGAGLKREDFFPRLLGLSNVAKQRKSSTADSVIESQLDRHLEELEQKTGGDALTYCGPITHGADDLLRQRIETLAGYRRTKKKKLVLLLETSGGYIEVAERMVKTLRTHYQHVDFFVPNYAMSAGTILVLSGNAIFMDYYSVLGPIDPQIERNSDGNMVPALGYLEFYDRLVRKSANGNLTTAELAYLLQKFDPAELYQFEQAREQSIALLKDWLVRYKFKNWVTTKSKKRRVSIAMKRQRAQEIAEMLGNANEWHSHGRGISMDVLQKKVRLQIEDFGKDSQLNQVVHSYYDLLTHYRHRLGNPSVIHCCGRFSAFGIRI